MQRKEARSFSVRTLLSSCLSRLCGSRCWLSAWGSMCWASQRRRPCMCTKSCLRPWCTGGSEVEGREVAQWLSSAHFISGELGERQQGTICLSESLTLVPLSWTLPALCRAPLLGALRSIKQTSMGALDAPFSYATICFMQACGLGQLEAWDPAVTAQAVSIYQGIAQRLLFAHEGCLVEAADGLCLAAFGNAAAAMQWALSTLDNCAEAAWPAELLDHNHGRPIMAAQASDPPHDQGGTCLRPAEEARGLRIKCGIDTGPLVTDLHAVTARVTYRGKVCSWVVSPQLPFEDEYWIMGGLLAQRKCRKKQKGKVLAMVAKQVVHAAPSPPLQVMNRCARICGAAKSGQVWASRGAWELASRSPVQAHEGCPHEAGTEGCRAVRGSAPSSDLDATSLGSFALKGINNRMELVQVVRRSS